ncbi:MAG: threonylcarbamoyl-AMP synthase [Myxococcales bacterium]|nr:threonylcarbamoyl-AMP synthase [Myxococcales bacterium]
MSIVASVLEVAPSDPGEAAIAQTVKVLEGGGVIALPTDTLYGIGCALDCAEAVDRIHAMRGIDAVRRPLTFLLPDLGEVARWAKITGNSYRVLTRIFPGPYCVELGASPRVPNPYLNPERNTIGVRIPDYPLCEKILWRLGRPILTATAKARDGQVLTTAADINAEFGNELDLILDAGPLSGPPSTVVSLVDDWVQILREGRGPASRVIMT